MTMFRMSRALPRRYVQELSSGKATHAAPNNDNVVDRFIYIKLRRPDPVISAGDKRSCDTRKTRAGARNRL